LSARVADGGIMDIVDVLPIQLSNLRKKLPRNAPVRLLAMDSTNLNLPDASYERALIFFLLHEQPSHYREQTLGELFRVVKPGGNIIIVDYDLPRWWHPLRYVWRPLLAKLEPFALRRPETLERHLYTWMCCGTSNASTRMFAPSHIRSSKLRAKCLPRMPRRATRLRLARQTPNLLRNNFNYGRTALLRSDASSEHQPRVRRQAYAPSDL
jgi:SAM-dependent methyltransferase